MGRGDPTTRLTDGAFTRATITPDGPGTITIRWTEDPADPAECGLDAEAWGPGSHWLLDRVGDLTGGADRPLRS